MKMKSFFLFIALLFAGVLVDAQDVASESSVTAQQKGGDPLSRGYMLGPGDQIAGNVNGEIGYEFLSTVDENGMIYLPFAKNAIGAQCITENELRAAIEAELKKYLRNPQLNFRIVEKRSRPPVAVYGEVNKPSEITLTRPRTLIEIMAIAGGPRDQEASGLIEVRRPRTPLCMANDDKDNWTSTPSRTFRLADITAGKEEANPIIYPGDVVFVQRAAPVYITGEVVAPQGVFLKERGLSLTEGIAQVGNPRQGAKKSKVNIFRLKPGASPESKDREVITANLDLIAAQKQKDIMLQPYDIVVVDKAKKPIGLAIAEIALGAAKSAANSIPNTFSYKIIY